MGKGDGGKGGKQPASRNPARSNFFSRLFFAFVDPLISDGYKRTLDPEDLLELDSVRTKGLHKTFDDAWSAELKKEQPDIRKAVIAGSARNLIFSGLLYGLSAGMQLVGPLMLNRIVGGLSCFALGLPTCESQDKLYLYCIGLFLAPVVQSLAENHMTWILNVTGTRMRNSLMAAIYRKCLRLSNAALQSESTGKVVTLMSNDAQKLQDAMLAIHSLWGAPCLIIAILVLLYQQVGWATFVGLAVMLLLGPLSGMIAGKLGGFRREILKWTDKRVGLMSEVINGIQMIKFYAWEKSFQEEVIKARKEETAILKKSAYWQGLFGMALFSGPVIVAIACFGSYTIAGNHLTTTQAYTALAFFSLLRFPMSFLPMLITSVVNAMVALKRIQSFLTKPEAEGLETDTTAEPGVVKVSNGVFVWDNAQEKPTLSDVSFEARPGSLTMVVGAVGSGKSSVLAALIHQIEKRSGQVSVGGRVAYVAQSAWIINDTVKENVLLGEEMDEQRYAQAIKSSQLEPDLQVLPNGDGTEIGDRGITLSGGQKQRVSIARAVYADADVYLLDDPLSAVDSHVGRALFDECIRGPLRNKTIILVTNALQYLPHADNILWIDNGRVRGQGTYQQLTEQGLNIAELVHVDEKHDGEEGKEAAAAGAADGKKAADGKAAGGDVNFNRSATSRNLTGVEAREQGNIGLEVLSAYFHAGGGWGIVALVVTLYAAEQFARVYTDTWVGLWFSDAFNKRDNWFYLGIYFGLGIAYGFITFLRSLRFLYTCVNGAINLHNSLLLHLLRLPKAFFDTNPAGRILNRFSRDTDIMDSTLPTSMIQFTGCVALFLASLVVVSIATRWFAIALIPLAALYFVIQRYYIPSARELQRIESVTRSPIYSRFGEALAGAATIRAYRRQQHFTDVSDELMQLNAFAFITQKATNSWLAMRLDVLGLAVLCLAGVLCIQGSISPAMAGLCLLYSLDTTRYLKFGTQMASQTESNFNSVERIVQYLKPETEADDETKPEVEKTLPKDWPNAGAIEAVKMTMRYRPETPLVLKGVSFSIKPGEKVGLVGRTGSGKSSMFLALFRMVEMEAGSIIIDGVDISTVGLHRLRSGMSIIPQDPFMFSGSVRHNLDPFDKHSDEQLWSVLEAVGLKPVISALELKLQAPVVDNGANFSQGQKQLFCLARAMLRRSRILMMDEATASVDPETDELIQVAIRRIFADCTMLTIAHRLNTIMDSDRVLVLEQGQMAEDDEPAALLQRGSSMFASMVDKTGRSSSQYLRDIASKASQQRIKRGASFGAGLSSVVEPAFAVAEVDGEGGGGGVVLAKPVAAVGADGEPTASSSSGEGLVVVAGEAVVEIGAEAAMDAAEKKSDGSV